MRVLDGSTMLLVVLFIQGCSSAVQPPHSSPTPPEKTVFDPLTHDLEKARGVQKTVDEQAERTRNGIDSQERGDSPQ
jgi:PBP1b-binding outer membrane lipoprotein LpoB